MGISKTAVFNQRQNKIAQYAKALAHPARVAIIEFLLKHESCFCGELVEELPLSQSTISQHLRELKNAGIIKGEIEGPRIGYCINEEAWEEARDVMINLYASLTPKKNCC
ncbi:DNA-binding transcriptional ArsR family regulator [Catalinimonas alkaloidigena]|uniref:ArsR/SmtB family transcription factor n=1 Tax=Catalinimonas alkaloidigena TaxID=1075417 RepID=UPI00240526CF|nr:metalloregulator ArsR/SmtB family transcription factor [Catalinimonas alkaloidigena]MDF9797823.1 DNA-binding transcriptional ArsR family regulator [Catalinimonas alkaloidigena]